MFTIRNLKPTQQSSRIAIKRARTSFNDDDATRSRSGTTTNLSKQLNLYIDSLTLKIFQKATITMNYSQMFKKIIDNFAQTKNNNFRNISLINIKVSSDHYITLFLPVDLQLSKIFSPVSFQTNWQNAFGTPIGEFSHMKYSQLTVKISFTGVSGGGDKYVCNDFELGYFRMLACLSFAFLFRIRCDMCACFPSSPVEMLAVQNFGLYMNCIKHVECISLLNVHPEYYDSRFMGDCDVTDMKNIQNSLISLELSVSGHNNNIIVNS